MGVIFNIQRFCLNDGPGIRTAVFFKGCPLNCAWCHNPEGLSPKREIGYDPRKCATCGACAEACPERHKVTGGVHIFERTGCLSCSRCVEACAFGALETAGRDCSASEVMRTVERDMPYYAEGGGGLTLTGGEPTMQFEFALELAKAAKAKGINVCLETSGFCATERLLALGEYVDLFLFDIKETDREKHREFVSVYPDVILENLRALDGAGASVVMRCPLIPSFNARDEHIVNLANLANSLNCIKSIELEPYHPLGIGKAERFGIKRADALPKETMSAAEAEKYLALLKARTDKPAKLA